MLTYEACNFSMKYTRIFMIAIAFFATLAPVPCHALAINSKWVLARTLSHSLEVKSTQLATDLSHQDVHIAKSQYDTKVSGQFNYTKDKSEQLNTIFGTESSTTNYNVAATQLTPLGTKVDLSFNNTKQTSNSLFYTANSLFEASTGLSLTQPLLQNSLGTNTRATVTLAQQNKMATQENVSSTLLTLAYQNLTKYWQWYLNCRLRVINQEALSAALRLYEVNRQKSALGLLDKSELYAFQANADLRRSDLLLTNASLAKTEGELKYALSAVDESLFLGKETMAAKTFPSADVMISESLASHPEYLAVKESLKAQHIDLVLKKNQRLPQIDLVGSLTLNGIDPNYNTALNDISEGHPVWMGGVNFVFPLQNRQARANLSKSKIENMQLIYKLKNIENKIVTQIREGVLRYQQTYKRLQAFASAAASQKLKWENEVTKYNEGRSDPDRVIQSQNDYLDTQKLYLQTQVDFQLAKLDLEYLRGRLE